MTRETNFPVTYAVGREEEGLTFEEALEENRIMCIEYNTKLEEMNIRLERSKKFLARKEEIYKELGESIEGMKAGILRQQNAILQLK